MMRSRVGVCLLGLLSLYSSVFGQDVVEHQHGVLIFCDDPSVEKAVSSALKKHNEGLKSGQKLALFQVLFASKSENGSDSVYSLEFSSRQSDCPAGSSKPWTDCDYLPRGHRAPISCNATVHMTETETDIKQVQCLYEPHLFPEKAPCLGCPEKIDEYSEDLKVPLSASIFKFNSLSDSTHLFTLHSVSHATRQVVAGFRYKLTFDLRKTTCAKTEHKDLNELCVPDEENIEFMNCNSTVDVAPWRLQQPEVHSVCETGALSQLRRRPAGWSPLRRVPDKNSSSGSPSALPAPSPSPAAQSDSKAPAKEESSEEDTTASKPSSSPDIKDNPFHCPSKPWKPFKPVHHDLSAAPTKPSAEASAKPPADGTLSDTDLLS